MKNYILKKALISSIFVAICLLIEVYFFINCGWGIFARYFLLDISIVAFIGFAIFLCRSTKAQISIASVVFGLFTLITYINICIMQSLDDVFSINMLTLVAETAEVITTDMFPIVPLLILIGFVAIFVVSIVVLCKKLKYEKQDVKPAQKFLIKQIVLWGLTICMAIGCVQTFFFKGHEHFMEDDKYLYKTFYSAKKAVKNFGMFSFYTQEVTRKIYNVNNKSGKNDLNDAAEYLATKEYENTDSALYGLTEGENLIVIMCETMEWFPITKELTPVLYGLANGYDFSDGIGFYDITYDDNKDATLVYDQSKYDETLEQTFGITMTNYYAKCKTDFSEHSVILGNYPFDKSFTSGGDLFGGFTASDLYNDINYGFTLPNMLKDAGKVSFTQYYHNYKNSFYGRNTLLPQWGFDECFFIEDVVRDGEVDVSPSFRLAHILEENQMIGKYKEQMFPTDETFFTFFTTVSTHGEFTTLKPHLQAEYDYIDNNYNYLWKDTDPAPDSNSGIIRTYLAAFLDLEWSVALMLDYLIEEGLYDNTTIVIYGDHQAYYNNIDNAYKPLIYSKDGYTLPGETEVRFNEWAQRNDPSMPFTIDNYDFSTRYHVPCMFYSTKINDETIEGREQYCNKFACSYDITPTIFTLFGVDYNENYYMGYPVMCEVDGVEIGTEVYVSRTGGIFNKDIYSADGIEVESKASFVTEADIKKFSKAIQATVQKNIMITLLYEHDLFESIRE